MRFYSRMQPLTFYDRKKSKNAGQAVLILDKSVLNIRIFSNNQNILLLHGVCSFLSVHVVEKLILCLNVSFKLK